jgi:cell fate regulator YaaT (PSP1 superfamily)
MRDVAAVRCGAIESVDFYESPSNGLREGDPVILRTERGLEWGELVSPLLHCEEGDTRLLKLKGDIVRKATEQDKNRHKEICEVIEKEEFRVCRSLIAQYELPMRVVSVEHLFGGNRTIFFFMADGRVDFRALVKELARQYRTRIEMRQIGVRDAARQLGRYGPCGRELCCRTFLKSLKPIPMKVAKSQKSTLDPAKISGRCGRLKCCLNFEDELYENLRKDMPRRGAIVRTRQGEGVVVGHELMEQAVIVKLADGGEVKMPLTELGGRPNLRCEHQDGGGCEQCREDRSPADNGRNPGGGPSAGGGA